MTEGISEMHLSDTSGKRKIIVQNESPSSNVVCLFFVFVGFFCFFVFFYREHSYILLLLLRKIPQTKNNVR